MEHIRATYRIETPLDPAHVAEVLAGEQSSGTFVRVASETDEVRGRSRAMVQSVTELEPLAAPSLPSAYLEAKHIAGPYRRADIVVDFPVANVGANLPTLCSTLAGNLFDLGEVTGLRLRHIALPQSYRDRFERPKHGIAGTRLASGIAQGPLLGTIIKPNVGMSADETAALVVQLCEAGVDFIKDDECCGNPDHAPVAERIERVMGAVEAYRQRSGRNVIVAINITDEHDAMLRHAEHLSRAGGVCAMVSLNWVGHASMQALRRHTDLILHGHRNGYGMWSRAPSLGMDFQAYAALWRLTGVDHMHVHGFAGKFSQFDAEVAESAADCFTPLGDSSDTGDVVMPAFSSGQWAATLYPTLDAVPSADVLFMCGGGILAHPGGAAAGVDSLRSAWQGWSRGQSLEAAAAESPSLAQALAFYRKA